MSSKSTAGLLAALLLLGACSNDLNSSEPIVSDASVPDGSGIVDYLAQGGQIWIERAEYAPSLIEEGAPPARLRIGAFFFQEPVMASFWQSPCHDMVNAPRFPIGLPSDREYLDVGEVTISGSGTTFPVERFEGTVDFLGRPPHDIHYQLVMAEGKGDSILLGGVEYSISFSGSSGVESLGPIELARLPQPISPAGSTLSDLELTRGSNAALKWRSGEGAYASEPIPLVLLTRADGTVVVLCSGRSLDEGVVVTSEALAWYLAHEPGGEGHLHKMTSQIATPWISRAPEISAWVFASATTIQKFRIVD